MTDNWATLQPLFDKLHAEFQFTLDVAALPENAKCVRFFTPEQDGLAQSRTTAHGTYNKPVWMNHPYERDIDRWLDKVLATEGSGERIVALIPNRSNAP